MFGNRGLDTYIMGRTKGSKNKPKHHIVAYRENKKIVLLTREVKNGETRTLYFDDSVLARRGKSDNGGKLVRDRDLDEKRGAEPGIRAGTL